MKARTKQEIANSLGISLSTLKRKLKTLKLDVPRGLIYPDVQKKIYTALQAKEKWAYLNQKEPKRPEKENK